MTWIDNKAAIPGSGTPILSVSGLTTGFKRNGKWRDVVRNVDFEVYPGETVAIVGESGSGKSVTSLSIMGLLAADSSRVTGSICLNGKNLLTLTPSQMRQVRGNDVAMIFQEPMTSLNPLYTVGWQLVEALQAHRKLSSRQAREEAVALLEKVRIPNAAGRFDEYPHRLSGGMRQRVMIAMALASRPKLLIADEPTTALDVTIQGQILELIKTLQEEEGTSVLFITHDMGVVAEIADRTVVMYQGEVVESGLTANIFAAPQQPYTRALLASVPMLGTMGERTLPLRFAVADKTTGDVQLPRESADTVQREVPPILSVSGLTNRFDIRGGLFGRLKGRVHAVENVSFVLQPGETLSLVGESGCGKSSTGRAILRLIEPSAGEIRLDGVDVMALSAGDLPMARRVMQMIFQDPYASLNPRMTVAEAIAEPYLEHRLGTRGQARTRVLELLDLVGLPDSAMDRYPHEFSGGQRQRICIARALVMDPKIIVADESVSALDGSVKGQVINLLLDLQERLGLSYLFISHDMAVVERISHRVAVMYLGEIVEIGPRHQVFGAPRHPYTKRLIEAVPIPDPARRRQRGSLSSEEIPSPIRSPGFTPPSRRYAEVSPGHFVLSAE